MDLGFIIQFRGQLRLINRQNDGGGGGGDEQIIINPVVEPTQADLLAVLLQEHALPPGLFPKEITDFQFDERTRKIAVTMPADKWELIRGSCVLRFSKTVTGLLERGKLSDINGMQTQTGNRGKISCIEIKQQSKQRKSKELLFTTDQGSTLTKRFLDFEVC